MPNVWAESDTEKLIAFYEQHQCLWNPFHSEFSNKLSRYEAYKEIKSSMNIPGLTICDCIKKIADAKKEYCYELSKITAAIFCEKLYTPKVKWFKRMHMLFFPHTQASYYTNYFKKQDNNEQKFNIDIQDNSLHLPVEKSEDKQICSSDVCGTCEPREIELRLRLRESVHSAPKLQDTLVPSETIQKIDVAAETSSGVIAREDTQTNILHEGRYITRNNEGKKDCSTCTHDISVEACGRKRIEDSFDIFGKSVAFQLRSIDTHVYQKHPCLWNPYDVKYYNCLAKNDALKNIIKELNISELNISDCLEQIKVIRAKYGEEQICIIKGLQSQKPYASPFAWFPIIAGMLMKVINDEEKLQNGMKLRKTISRSILKNHVTITHDKNIRTPSFPCAHGEVKEYNLETKHIQDFKTTRKNTKFTKAGYTLGGPDKLDEKSKGKHDGRLDLLLCPSCGWEDTKPDKRSMTAEKGTLRYISRKMHIEST